MKKLVAIVSLCIAGCTSVDYHHPRDASTAIPTSDVSALDRSIAPLTAQRPPDMSGFYLLTDGIDAAASRLRLAQLAERSIDVQYYLIKRDRFGKAFLHSLLAAADRGVRVRLLLDDMFNKHFDHGMLALDAHPNFEIRVFNPFNRGALGGTVGAAFNIARINRRMHNKSFTVDNRITIIGGRNIADEYFGAREDSAFSDLDVIGIGPIVDDVSQMFDRYWAHETAVPLAGFIKPLNNPEQALSAYRQKLVMASEGLAGTRYAEQVIDRAYRGVQAGIDDIRWSPYKFIVDPPGKGVKGEVDEADMIIAPLAESLSAARNEAMIISPYFVPRDRLMSGLLEASGSGVDVAVVTNSLAANNQALVHGGYAPSRKPLLEAGVELYEARPDVRVAGTEYVDASAARSTLHTKAYVLDRREVFIGSFNFDPRSAYLNTEMGVLIHDDVLGERITTLLQDALSEAAWQVVLTPDKTLEWRGLEDGEPTTHDHEPMTNWWQRFTAAVYRVLPIKSQL